MLIVFLPLWQIVTFLPYASWAALIALWRGADAAESGQGGEQADRHGGGGLRLRRASSRGLVNWAPFNSVQNVLVLPRWMLPRARTPARQLLRFCSEFIDVEALTRIEAARLDRGPARARAVGCARRGRARRPSSRDYSSERSRRLRRAAGAPVLELALALARAAATASSDQGAHAVAASPRERRAPALRRGRRAMLAAAAPLPTCRRAPRRRAARAARASRTAPARQRAVPSGSRLTARRTAAQKIAVTVTAGISQSQSTSGLQRGRRRRPRRRLGRHAERARCGKREQRELPASRAAARVPTGPSSASVSR